MTDQYTFSEPSQVPQGSPQDLPEVAKKWNWGAFFLGWIWGIGNNVWISFLHFVPLVSLVMPFVLGVKGGEWAWKNKNWQSVEHFQKVQRTWAWVGFGITAFFLFIILLGLLTIFIFALIDEAEVKNLELENQKPLTVIPNQLKPIELSGKDDQTESFTLSKGFIVAEANHYGDRPFVAKLLDKDGKVLKYLFNESSGYDGKRFYQIDEDGVYSLKVETDGSWDIKIDQNTPEDLKSAPHELTGRKDDVVFINIDGNKNARLHFTHNGEDNFIVTMNGHELLVNEIGEYDDSITKQFVQKGLYAFSIEGDGDWSVSVEYE